MATPPATQQANRERTADDMPDMVKAALAEREAAILAGQPVPKFDEDGQVVEHG